MIFNLLEKEYYDDLAEMMLSSYPQSNPSNTDNFIKFLTNQYEKDKTSIYISTNDRNNLLGAMRLIDYRLNIRNTIIQASGVGSVCVSPLHRKEKVAKEIVSFFLNNALANKKSMAVLYPFKRTFYKSMGFGYGTKMHKYLLKPSAFPRHGCKSSLSYLGVNDIDDILNCYNHTMKCTNGMLSKSESDFKNHLEQFKTKVIGCKIDNILTGYLIYQYEKPINRFTYEGNIEIIDFVYHNTETLNQLLYFLNSQQDQVERIGLTTQDEYFDFKLLEAQNEQSHTFGDYELESFTTAIGLMYRIVSFENFIGNLHETNFNDTNLIVAFRISDSLIKENNSEFIVAFSQGTPTISLEPAQVTLSIDISELSSLFMGSVNFKSLINLGLASIDKDSYLSQLDTLFSYNQKPQCTTKF